MSTLLVWLRNDLRLGDNPALAHAMEDADTVIPLFIWAPDEEGAWAPGGAHRWWLHHSLTRLQERFTDEGSQLILRTGASTDVLDAIIEETGADGIYWNQRHVPALDKRDAELIQHFDDKGLNVTRFPGRLLHDPEAIETTTGGPYHVYTPFWRKFNKLLNQTRAATPPLPAPEFEGTAPDTWPASDDVSALQLLPEARDGVDWADGLRATWTPGEGAAHQRLEMFLAEKVHTYDTARDRPDQDGTSRLSPYLHHGELSPRQVWHATHEALNGDIHEDAESFLQEIVWREFSYHLLHHYPETDTQPLKDKFADFAWVEDDEALERWQQGETGYPIVDAGMRQLYETGWMHNRVRMIVGSFLTKDLRIHWLEGARWFWDTLVDGDLASNTMGWQWAAGSGADAQPFFRIFNPVSQSERHDPNGDYIRRFVPEIADLPTKYLHAPWDAPSGALKAAGITLGETYPMPMVDHSDAREQALDAYEQIK